MEEVILPLREQIAQMPNLNDDLLEKHKKWMQSLHCLRNGKEFPATDGQAALFHIITYPTILRGVIRTTTQ